MKENTTVRRFCGNCGSHTAYNYPDKVFCGKRFSEDKDPIVETLWYSEEWNMDSQECYCVKEATKKQK